MNLRIAYYVVAFAISLATFSGAYGYAYPAYADADRTTAARDAAGDAADDAAKAGGVPTWYPRDYRAYIAARDVAVGARAVAASTARAAYGIAAAVSVAAFAGAYILDKRRTPPEG